MDPITVAMGLAQFAPWLIKLLTGSDKAAEVAGKVVTVAQAVTGAPTGPEALAKLQADPAKVLEFQQAIGAQQADLEKAYLADRADARSHDVEVRRLTGGRNHRADIMVALDVVGLIACLAVLVVFKGQLPGEVVGIVSTVAGIFGACLRDAHQFEFGSSRNNHVKDEIISQLTVK